MLNSTSVFTLLGVLFAGAKLTEFVDFIWFHFLRPASWQIYLEGPTTPYALITGATDGIGKGIAKDLYAKGFNLILHGRDEAKMDRVMEELRNLVPKGGDIRVFFADASTDGLDFDGIAKTFTGLDITLVVNNVGGFSPKSTTVEGWGANEHLEVLRLNMLFTALFTRAMLPGLRKTSHQRPVQVVFTGSYSASAPMPRLVMYSASKAFINRLSQNLHADERFGNPDSKLSFVCLEIASVKSNVNNNGVSLVCPDADHFAKSAVQAFGSGKQAVIPYFAHAVMLYFVGCLPCALRSRMIRDEMVKVLEQAEKVV